MPWIANKMYTTKCLNRFGVKLIAKFIADAYDITHGFVQAHEHVCARAAAWGFGQEAKQVIAERCGRCAAMCWLP